jgi:oligoribonuclease NrnB/cAMP/cGMP phosphodiesterase (DHH superfamily)
MKVLIFSHESDLDGLYSAAIGIIRYPQAMTVFLGYGAENFNRIGGFIHSATGYHKERGLVIIADLGLNDDLIDTCKQIFSEAVRDEWQIIWIDHHPWSQLAKDSVSGLAELVLDTTGAKCASDLMYEKLVPGNTLAAKLAAMAHTMDFFTKDQYLTPVSELIKYYQTLPDFYERLSQLARKSAAGILWDVEMQADYNEYTKLRDKAKMEVLASIIVRPAGRFKVAYVQSSPYLQNSIFSEDVFAKTAADLVMFYSSKGKVSIRRSNQSISCREVAANLAEGGGHEYSAGALFRSDPYDSAAVLAELEAAVIKATSSSGKP